MAQGVLFHGTCMDKCGSLDAGNLLQLCISDASPLRGERQSILKATSPEGGGDVAVQSTKVGLATALSSFRSPIYLTGTHWMSHMPF